MYLKLTCIAALSFLLSVAAAAQTRKINELKKKVDNAITNDERLAAIVAYCEDYANISRDSLEKYAYVALELAASTKDEKLKSLAWLTLAQDYMQWGWTDSVHAVVAQELPGNKITDPARRNIYFRLKRLDAIAFGGEGKIQESLAILYPLSIEADKYGDSLEIAGIANTIGAAAAVRNELKEAHKWNQKALAYATENLGSVYVSRAQLLYKEGRQDSVLYYLQKGIALCNQVENYDRLAGAYRFQSAFYVETANIKEAETALVNMQTARRKINGNPDAIIDDNLQIADFYASTGQLKKAIAFCWSKLEMGDLIKEPGEEEKSFNNDPAVRLPFFIALARYLKEDGNASEYQKVLEEIVALKDTVYEINKAEAIAELQTKYDVAEKENRIIEQELKITQRNYLLYGSIVFIVLAGIIGWLWYRTQSIKQKNRMEQAIEEEKRRAAESILNAEEKERKRIAADLHDNIGAYATAISADVETLSNKGIEAGGRQLENLQLHSKEIIHSLRDTIWVLNKENITITGISDRIKNYVNKIKPSYSQLNIVVEENVVNDVRVGSQKALNIFRIVQEAIHNALKHSDAGNIIVGIKSDDTILITVTDNGKGLQATENENGNGLRNMRVRAEDAGIDFNLQSAANEGTKILLEVV